jgi:hypothetical protein
LFESNDESIRNKRNIGIDEFENLLDYQVSSQYNSDKNDPYLVDDTGVKAKPLTDQDKMLLDRSEFKVLREFEKEAKLSFQCSVNELLIWCENNGYDIDPVMLEEYKSQGQISESSNSTIEPEVAPIAAIGSPSKQETSPNADELDHAPDLVGFELFHGRGQSGFPLLPITGIAKVLKFTINPKADLAVWKVYARKANENRLKKARVDVKGRKGKKLFDPYLVGEWLFYEGFMERGKINDALCKVFPRESEKYELFESDQKK